MHNNNYKDLLEQRTTLKSMKESMFRLNPKEDFSKINKSTIDASKLSIPADYKKFEQK